MRHSGGRWRSSTRSAFRSRGASVLCARELIAFFGREPIEIDSEEAEFFDSLSFEHDLGGDDVLVCDIGGNFGDLALSLSRKGVVQIVVRADDVARLKIERLHGAETLVGLFGNKDDLREVRLSLRPTLRLDWGANLQG
jgi:hypothetical protein